MTKMVGVENFRNEVMQLLHEYGIEAREVLNETVPEAANICVKMIRGNSKKHTGKYAKGWTKKEQHYRGLGTSYVVYNRDRYRVAHLLERSHAIRNQYGTYGTSVGDGVIADAAEYAEEWLVDETTKRLNHDV